MNDAEARSESPMEVGYPTEIFPQGFDEKLICNSCNKVLKDPVQSYCGHRFCKPCINREMSKGQQVRCQTCIREGAEEEDYSMISKDHIFPDNALRREMFSMEATCLNQGCDWSGKFRHFEKHADQCKFKPVTCQQCHGLVEAARYKHHLGNDCPKRPIKCQFCKQDFSAELYEPHKSECPKFPVKCDDCGKKKLTRDMLQHHYENECSQRKIPCPAGCDPVERNRFLTHLDQKSGYHLQFIMDQLKKLTQEINTRIGESTPMSDILQVKQSVEQLQVKVQQIERSSSATGSEDNTAMQQRCRALELKVGTFEGIVTTLHREIERCLTHLDTLERGGSGNSGPVAQRVEQLERALAQKERENQELRQYIDNRLSVTYDGEQIWRIDNWTKLRKDAISGMKTSIFSAPFYTSRHGYKMCVRLYPNGDGMGRGTHISVFFVVMMGEYDPLLKWPFRHRVTFRMVNQNTEDDQTDSFRPDPNSSSFKKPASEMNIASGCPLFIPLTKINDTNSGFVKNDVLFLKTTVTLMNS